MVFLRIKYVYTLNTKVPEQKDKICTMEYLNEYLGTGCGFDGKLSAAVFEVDDEAVSMVACADGENVVKKDIIKYFDERLKKWLKAESVECKEFVEIPTDRMISLSNRQSARKNSGFDICYDLGISYLDNAGFTVKSSCIQESIGKKTALKSSRGIMADDSFLEEIERIYQNKKYGKFYGHPVHYHLSVSSEEASEGIINILVASLMAKNRLIGGRIETISELKHDVKLRFFRDDIIHLFETSGGNTVVINTSGTETENGEMASAYEEITDLMAREIIKHHKDTLYIFVEECRNPGFSKQLLSKVNGDLNIIDINEGRSKNRKDAVDALVRLTEKDDIKIKLVEAEMLLGEGESFLASEVYEAYRQWKKDFLIDKLYTSYKKEEYHRVKQKKSESCPYSELKEMVGLHDVKKLVDNILDMARVNKMRKESGAGKISPSLHMVFTGNPGSAKTTVARLLGQILKAEGILTTGEFLECGRADLVGKYVGWTANKVRGKFRMARGGILFIDEAYALVDRGKSFGDEAINTIVQEMENHRDEVIVIFAGYPDKMREFLEKNEGLKSRISFHLDFPDYNEDELTEILKLMVKNKNLWVDDICLRKCKDIFKKACGEPDFGNGRFVRNLLEQAVVKQAGRIMRENIGKRVSSRKLQTLVAEDFDVKILDNPNKYRKNIGFVV